MCWITPLYLYWLVFEKSLKANRHPLVLWMCSAAQLCPALCNPMNCNPPGSSVHGILPARILKWGAISSSRDFPDLGIEPVSLVSCLGRQILYHWATWEIHPLDKSNVVRLVIILKVGAIFKCLLCILSDINQFLSIYCDEPSQWLMGFPGSSDGQESASNAADPGSIPGSGRSPEKGMATHFPILAWRIPWIEKPGRLQPTGSQRVGNDWATNTFTLLFSTLWLIRWILLSSYSLYMRIFIVEFLLQLFSGKESTCKCRSRRRLRFDPWVGKIPWRRAWQPTPVFLPGEPHGQRSLAGYCSSRHKVGYDQSECMQAHDWIAKESCHKLHLIAWQNLEISSDSRF